MEPGFNWKLPLGLEQIHVFPNNTIIIEATGGQDRNTQDQNMLSADLRFHFKHDPKFGLVALHAKTMQNDDGEDILKKLISQSVDAVVGDRHSRETTSDPSAFLKSFGEDLQWRITQNNLPIRFEAVELLSIQIGDGMNPYRTPIQLRLRPDEETDWVVEQMSGPGAVAVPSAGGLIEPRPAPQPTIQQPAPQ